jgi:hypothetical protein
MKIHPPSCLVCQPKSFGWAGSRRLTVALTLVLSFVHGARLLAAQAKAAADPDTVVFTNGDRLTGKLVREVGGKVTFHSDIAGDVTVTWDKIKELHSSSPFAVLQKGVTPKRREGEGKIPIGTLAVTDGKIQLEPAASHAQIPAIATSDASYIVDQPELDKELLHSPGFFQAWNGSATGGVTLVKATQSQYTVNSAVALARIVPTVNWLAPRNRTTADFNSSFGKITEPGFTVAGVFTPATETKSNIAHGDAERDQYFSPRFYYLGELSYDHNYSQSLQLQQIYGAGVGYTVIKKPKSELDVKLTAQYEKQQFFTASANQNLIGATLAANYLLTLPRGMTFTQQLSFIPAFNVARAYSATETDTLNLPAYKNFSLTVGSLDSYLNDVPLTVPPTRRNSFQFTIGATYALKSKY